MMPILNGSTAPFHNIIQKLHDSYFKSGWDIDINEKDPYGQTPLSLACEQGYYKIVDLLLEDGRIQVNQSDLMGRTELYIAAEFGYDKIVKRLLASNWEM